MPPVREIDLSDGIRIVTSGSLANVNRPAAEIVAVPGNLVQKEVAANQWLQQQYENRIALADLPPDDRVLEDPPDLRPYERIEKIGGIEYWIGIIMYVAVHIYSLSPLRLNIATQNKELGPIIGGWW